MSQNETNLIEFLRKDVIDPYLIRVPETIHESYIDCWDRLKGYPFKIRQNAYCLNIYNEINSALYKMAGEFSGLKRDLPKNKSNAYPYALIRSKGIKLTASRVGHPSAPRDAKFREEIQNASSGFLFAEPILTLNEEIYLQLVHGWSESKTSCSKPDFIKLRYFAPSLGRALYVDLYEYAGVSSLTLQKSIPKEIIAVTDNFQFREIDDKGIAQNEG